MRSMNTIKLGKKRVLVQCLYRPNVLLRGSVVFVNGGRYSGKIMSISVHKLFNISLGLEPIFLTQLKICKLSFYRFPIERCVHWLPTIFCRQEMCVSPQNAGVDDGRRECSISCTVFVIVWLSSLSREIGNLNLDILCFSSVHAKNRDFPINIHHDHFLPHAFQFTIHYSFKFIYFVLLTLSLNKNYIT
jgi:hypothetical protein